MQLLHRIATDQTTQPLHSKRITSLISRAYRHHWLLATIRTWGLRNTGSLWLPTKNQFKYTNPLESPSRGRPRLHGLHPRKIRWSSSSPRFLSRAATFKRLTTCWRTSSTEKSRQRGPSKRRLLRRSQTRLNSCETWRLMNANTLKKLLSGAPSCACTRL